MSLEDFEDRPTGGPEVGDTELVVNNEADFRRLVNGESVVGRYIN